MYGASHSTVLSTAAIQNSCWTPSFSYILCWSFLGWEIWPPYHKSVKVYYSVLLVYANLIFALLVCQSYKTYLVHRISILYHGDHNVDSNILSYIGAYAQVFISSCAQKIIHMHSSLMLCPTWLMCGFKSEIQMIIKSSKVYIFLFKQFKTDWWRILHLHSMPYNSKI